MSYNSQTVACDVLVIGAGAIGLAVGAELPAGLDVILVESNEKFGQETSSRNSEVVHSGIYYPKDSNKTKWCIDGRRMLYAFCEREAIPFRQTGKIVVAARPTELDYLERLAMHCQALGVSHQRLSGQEVSAREAEVAADAGILFHETGIFNSHLFMAALAKRYERRGGTIAYRHAVRGVRRDGDDWFSAVETPAGVITVRSRHVVNVSGLLAAALSNQALETDEFEHRYCRGAYFQLGGNYRHRFKHLIYPVPQADGLGVHVTLDLDGGARLGPDVEWCAAGDAKRLYDIDWEARKPAFIEAARRYMPVVRGESLSPGLVGVRPKLFVNGAAHPDFLVENRRGFVHCLGIESPGLTASLAIAKEVVRLVTGEGRHG